MIHQCRRHTPCASPRARMHRYLILAALCRCFTDCSVARAQNFTGSDPAILEAAETARIESAIFWTGHDLPGRWSSPCPIVIEPRPARREQQSDVSDHHSSSGRTTFQFEDGEVHGWRMFVSGSREAILVDVIPHEVDHMVRASLVRKPLPRWLDEGCATLRESTESRRRLREILRQYPLVPLTTAFLNAREYPSNSRELTRTYAVGFSLVEFLLERGGPRRLLELQKQSGDVAKAIADVYGLSIGDLNTQWNAWFVNQSASKDSNAADGGDLLLDAHKRFLCDCRAPPPNLLTIYSATWCAPCRRFWNDLASDEAFRDRLLAKFHLHWVDVDRDRRAAAEEQVTSLPTFLHGSGRVEGYEGPDWLLTRLEAFAASPAQSPPTAPVQPTSPSKSEPTPDETPRRLPTRGILKTAGKAAPYVFTALQMLGLIGGTVATGGVGGAVIAFVLSRMAARRARASSQASTGKEDDRPPAVRAPFPRHLDEARELLELRQSEGRVAALDALRGMFLDDEVGKVISGGDPAEVNAARRLMNAINARVDEVAPLATKVE